MSEVATLHVPFVKLLRERGVEFVYSRPDRESTIEAGWPDFTLLHARRGPLLIEFKDKDTRIAAIQKLVHARLDGKGLRVYIVRELSAAILLLDEWSAQAPKEEPQREASCFIRSVPGHGDHTFLHTGRVLRRTTVDDLANFPRRDA